MPSSKHQSHPQKRYAIHGLAVIGVLGLTGIGMAYAPDATKLVSFEDQLLPKQSQQLEAASDDRVAEDKVEAALYSRVMRVRKEIAMGNDDLAALGLTEAQAEDVLMRLVEWVELNQAAMIQADNTAESARQELAALERRIRTGLADDSELAGLSGLRQQVAEATTACETICQQAGTHAIAPAPEAIRGQWQAASTYRALPLDMRHLPDLDQQRVGDLMDAISQQANPQGAGALPLSSVQAMDEIRARVQAHRAGVTAAEARVLPVPAEMRDDEAGMFLDEDQSDE